MDRALLTWIFDQNAQVLSATCAAIEGTEALLSYASQGNAAFLTMYGFVPERNPFAAMELFGDVREAAAWAVNIFPPPVCPMSMPFSHELG